MTMVLSLITAQAVVQVSDRRVTWLDAATRRPVHFDDHENKAVVFRNRAVLAYTGASRIKSDRTDRWITETLGLECRIDEGQTHLGECAARAWADPSLHGQGLAVIAAGWSTVEGRPVVSVTSNFMSRGVINRLSNGRTPIGLLARDAPRPVSGSFSSWQYELDAQETHLLHVAGQALPDWPTRKILGMTRRALRQTFSPARMIDVLADAIRSVARVNPTVGANLMASVIPASAISNSEPMLLSGTPLSAQPTCLYLPAVGRAPERYMANFAGNGAVFTDASGTEDGFRMGMSMSRGTDGCRD